MIGTILNDRYEILEKIGEDDIIEIYKARCYKLDRYDTIKILKKNYMDNPFIIEDFKREAAELAKLSNANIVNVYDVVYQGDINYMVMEYVIGKSLKELIIENVKLSYERSINIAVQIAKALDCAHKNNITHRAIRPENILITEGGTVKVTNFSIKKVDKDSTSTNSHEFTRIMRYYSPEQVENNPVDARADIYSLGIVMYEMVTGKLPFNDENPAKIRNKIHQELAIEPIQLNSNIPLILNNIIKKCIEKDPNNRCNNASEILIDLLSLQNNIDYQVVSKPVQKDHTQVMPPISLPKAQRENFKARQVKKVNKSKVNDKTKSYLLYTLMGIMVLIVGIVAVMSISGLDTSNKDESNKVKTILVPNVAEKSREDAKKAIKGAGFVYREITENSYDVEEGVVIATNPEIGTSAKQGTTIEVIVSSGPPRKTVPNLIGKYESEAKEIVPQNGFRIGKTKYIRDGRFVRYHVVDQTPKPGEELEEGGVITYTVNLQ
ncbi:MAG: protein kinase [Clostridia bacterium]|jgi:serine/threonine-protein kinase|nr:protein kinase [Clostridia bacterium]